MLDNVQSISKATQIYLLQILVYIAAIPVYLKLCLCGLSLILSYIWLFPKLNGKFKQSSRWRVCSRDLEKPLIISANEREAPKRLFGAWASVDYQRPPAQPYPKWNIHTTDPLPYRPFRHGPYHITMGLRKMNWDEWIELDNQFPRFHTDKLRRIEERGSKCCKTAPEAFDGAIELLEEL